MDVENVTKMTGVNDTEHIETSEPGIPVFAQVMITMQVLCSIAIVSGNMLVLTAIIKFRSLQNVTSVFVANLAVADLIVGLALPFQITFFLYPQLDKIKFACLLRFEIISFACNASIYSLVCTVIDRYVAISYPLRYPYIMTKTVASILVVCIWTVDITTACISLFVVNNFNNAPYCLFELVTNKNVRFFNFVSGLIFACIMVDLYLRIYFIVRQHVLRIQTVDYMREQSMRAGRQWNIVVAFVVVFFLVSWLPFFIIQLTMLEVENVTQTKVLTSNFLVFLGIMNSIVNPVIYALKNRQYRRAFQKLLRMKASPDNDGVVSTIA